MAEFPYSQLFRVKGQKMLVDALHFENPDENEVVHLDLMLSPVPRPISFVSKTGNLFRHNRAVWSTHKGRVLEVCSDVATTAR